MESADVKIRVKYVSRSPQNRALNRNKTPNTSIIRHIIVSGLDFLPESLMAGRNPCQTPILSKQRYWRHSRWTLPPIEVSVCGQLSTMLRASFMLSHAVLPRTEATPVQATPPQNTPGSPSA